ncbi:MAG: hypothetical protein KBD37_07275 [Burkholderiales bacterium]|nr:hypothetical protein [Burkholderiales bacterium]
MKIANLCFFAIIATSIAGCNTGTTPSSTIESSTPTPAPTSPVPMPTSTWINTNLDTYLSANALEKLNTGLVVESTGVYIVARGIVTQQRAVLFYSSTTQSWSNITGNLESLTITSASSTGGVSTNGNGTIYTTSVPTVLSVYTGNSTWQNISLPTPSAFITISAVEAQTRKIFVLGSNGATPATYQPYELTSGNTLSAILNPVTAPTGGILVSGAVSPDGSYYYAIFSFTTPAHKEIAVNGTLYAESLPTSYTQSIISNSGYSYSYPSGTVSVSGAIIYECVNNHCLPITSANSILEANDAILSLTPLKTAGNFSVSVSNSITAVSRAYICNSTICTQEGNTLSESAATLFNFNPYIANPLTTSYGVGSGFFWLESDSWVNLAPSLNDGNESGAATDSVSVACRYSQATPLIRLIQAQSNGNGNRNQSLYANTATAWTNISESAVAPGTYTTYSSMISAVSPSTGASTFAGMAAFIKTDVAGLGSNNVENLWLYPITTVVCPNLY